MNSEIIYFILNICIGVFLCYFLLAKVIKTQYELKLKKWMWEKEKEIRADAIKKSRAVLGGKFSENIAPYLPNFNYNPSDARFIGAPIDFVIFDGLSDDNLKQIIFLEVKSSNSKLSKREANIREKIREGKVKWELYHVPDKVVKIKE